MMTTMDYTVIPNEDRVVQRLRECGKSSLDDLPRLTGLDWATVFSIIDRLSRAGFVLLKRQGADYLVSLENSR
jgi:DNA-binding MarR family transcriptional regulator